jgi:hypothetical protein
VNAEERQERGRPSRPDLSLPPLSLNIWRQKEKAPQDTRGAVHMGHNGQGNHWGGNPPSRDTNPRDCPKFRPRFPTTTLARRWVSKVCRCGRGRGSMCRAMGLRPSPSFSPPPPCRVSALLGLCRSMAIINCERAETIFLRPDTLRGGRAFSFTRR